MLGANDDPQNRDIRKSLSDLIRKPGFLSDVSSHFSQVARDSVEHLLRTIMDAL